MFIRFWKYDGINEDGRFGDPPDPSLGCVDVAPGVKTSHPTGLNTYSEWSDGQWMSISTGRRPDGTMQGMTIYFANEEEFRQFSHTGTLGIDRRVKDLDGTKFQQASLDPPDTADYWKTP